MERWDGASLTDEARRKAWWKQAKKQHGELCGKYEKFLEQLGESAHPSTASTAPATAAGSKSCPRWGVKPPPPPPWRSAGVASSSS